MALLMAAYPSTIYAAIAGSSGPVPTSAVVSGAATFSAVIYKNRPCPTGINCPGPDFASGSQTSMNFGPLKEVTFVSDPDPITGKTKTFKELRSVDDAVSGSVGGFAVILTANTHSMPYAILQSPNNVLIAGADNIPIGAATVTPVYSADDNGGAVIPVDAIVYPAGPWYFKNDLYWSGAGGQARTVQAVYGISGLDPRAGGTEIVPIDQRSGNYTTSILFSLYVV